MLMAIIDRLLKLGSKQRERDPMLPLYLHFYTGEHILMEDSFQTRLTAYEILRLSFGTVPFLKRSEQK
jgi:hypothetical protein